jgi:hypothetical protein
MQIELQNIIGFKYWMLVIKHGSLYYCLSYEKVLGTRLRDYSRENVLVYLSGTSFA